MTILIFILDVGLLFGSKGHDKYFQLKMLQFIDMCQNGMKSYFSWKSERKKSESLNIFDKQCSGFY